MWKQLCLHLSSANLRESCAYLFSLYWLWNSLSFTALYSFWYLRSCSLILETSVVNACGKLSACCRWNCCSCICSVKRLASCSSWTSDSCVLDPRKTDLHNEQCIPSMPLATPVGGLVRCGRSMSMLGSGQFSGISVPSIALDLKGKWNSHLAEGSRHE